MVCPPLPPSSLWEQSWVLQAIVKRMLLAGGVQEPGSAFPVSCNQGALSVL